MAEAARNRLPSGHDEEFVSEVDDDFQCPICQLPLKEPVLTACGHRFCRDCLEEHLSRQEAQAQPYTCPADREGLDRDRDIFSDKATERKILSLHIKCPSEGCEWTGELRAKENHLASCQLMAVSCTNQNCEVKVVRKDLTEHVTSTCQWRVVKCDYCEERHPQCLMENHHGTCDSFPTSCPNDCGTIASRDQLTSHIERSCPQTKVPCPYLWIGCHPEIRRGELESHLQLETRHHLELACCQLNDTQEEVKENTRKLHSLQEKVKSCQNVHQQEINNLQNQLEEKVKSCQKEYQREINKLQYQLQESENILRRRSEDRINNHQTEINEKVNTNYNKVEKEINNARKALFCFIFIFVSVVSAFSHQIYKVQPQQTHNIQQSFERKVNVLQNKFEEEVKRKVNSIQSKIEEEVERKVNVRQSQIEEEVKGKVKVLQSKFEEEVERKVNVLQSQIEEEVERKVNENKFEEEVKGKVNVLQSQIEEEVKRKVNALQSKFEEEVERKVNFLQSKFEEEVERKVNVLQSQIKEEVKKVWKNCESRMGVVANQLETKLNEVHKTVSDRSNSFTWKITGFEYILSQAKKGYQTKIKSDPFYIFGYKLKLLIYPDGDGDRVGTHISIFIFLIKGANDAVLSWPFYKTVTFTLIDQQENLKNRENIVLYFKANPEIKKCFGRPVKDQNIGYGFPKFVSHDKLRKRRYIVDDTIFIQVELATPFF